MVDYQTIGVLIAAASVVIGVINSILVSRGEEKQQELMLKNQEITLETRQAELFMGLYNIYNDVEFVRYFTEITRNWEWKDYEDWQKKYGLKTNIEAYSSWASVGNYFKGVGVLVQKKLIDISLVDELMSSLIFDYWEKSEHVIKEYRKQYRNPKAWEWVEYLYNELKSREPRLTSTRI